MGVSRRSRGYSACRWNLYRRYNKTAQWKASFTSGSECLYLFTHIHTYIHIYKHIYVLFRFAICERHLAQGCAQAQPMKAREASFYGVLTARVAPQPPTTVGGCGAAGEVAAASTVFLLFQPLATLSLFFTPLHSFPTFSSSFTIPPLQPSNLNPHPPTTTSSLSFTMYWWRGERGRGWGRASCYALLCA